MILHFHEAIHASLHHALILFLFAEQDSIIHAIETALLGERGFEKARSCRVRKEEMERKKGEME